MRGEGAKGRWWLVWDSGLKLELELKLVLAGQLKRGRVSLFLSGHQNLNPTQKTLNPAAAGSCLDLTLALAGEEASVGSRDREQ